MAVAKSIYEDWVDSDGGFLFPSLLRGSEVFPGPIMSGIPFGPGADFFKYQVLVSSARP